MTNRLSLKPYWEKIVDYYYDHIHYDLTPKVTIQTWIKNQYNATIVLERNFIIFEKESDKTMFLLRWT